MVLFSEDKQLKLPVLRLRIFWPVHMDIMVEWILQSVRMDITVEWILRSVRMDFAVYAYEY